MTIVREIPGEGFRDLQEFRNENRQTIAEQFGNELDDATKALEEALKSADLASLWANPLLWAAGAAVYFFYVWRTLHKD